MADCEITPGNLKRLRKARRLVQEDIARLIGVPREAVSKIETGRRELSESEKRLLEWYFFGKVPVTTRPAFLKHEISFQSASLSFDWRGSPESAGKPPPEWNGQGV